MMIMSNRRDLSLLFLVMFLVMAGFGIIIPVLPFYAEKIGATPTQLGWLMAVYSLMQVFICADVGEIIGPIWTKTDVACRHFWFSPFVFLARRRHNTLDVVCRSHHRGMFIRRHDADRYGICRRCDNRRRPGQRNGDDRSGRWAWIHFRTGDRRRVLESELNRSVLDGRQLGALDRSIRFRFLA
ncbi:hypothetical protein DI43_09325 [Geobacillus sp. CAMR12739]|nr:hypothetical protein DI43_09325 [Geobacillus sp. CAMR12739]